jgi:hypothetical protein
MRKEDFPVGALNSLSAPGVSYADIWKPDTESEIDRHQIQKSLTP